MTERCSTSTSLILSGGSSSTTGQRDAASLSSRFEFWFGVKIPSTFILVSTDFELSAICKIVKVFLTGTSLQPSWGPHQTKQALVDWANIFGEQIFLLPASDKTGSGGLSKYFWWQQCWANVFGDNNVDCLQSNLVQMQMCTNFPVQQPLFAFPLIYFRLWSMSYWEAFSSRLFCNPGSGNSIKAYLFQDASSSCLVMQQQQQQQQERS